MCAVPMSCKSNLSHRCTVFCLRALLQRARPRALRVRAPLLGLCPTVPSAIMHRGVSGDQKRNRRQPQQRSAMITPALLCDERTRRGFSSGPLDLTNAWRYNHFSAFFLALLYRTTIDSAEDG